MNTLDKLDDTINSLNQLRTAISARIDFGSNDQYTLEEIEKRLSMEIGELIEIAEKLENN